jgi:hypothetical protein
VKIGNFEKIICKHAVLSLHDISPSRLKRITSFICEGVVSPTDKRGGRRETWCKPEGLKAQMKEHITPHPFWGAHYDKGGKKTRYLTWDLSVKTTCKMYFQKCEPVLYLFQETPGTRFKPQITYEYFLRFYKENFHYPFRRMWEAKTENSAWEDCSGQTHFQRVLQLHKCKSKRFYDECQTLVKLVTLVKEGGAEHSTSECAVFDYMQNIPYTYIPVTEMFYAR